MAHLYFDSIALVKLYIAEAGTEWLQGLCEPTAGHTIYTARISGAEIVAALFRRARTGALSPSDAHTAAVQFKSDFHGGYQIVEVTELSLPSITFISADDTLNSAAYAEGLAVDNPNNHP